MLTGPPPAAARGTDEPPLVRAGDLLAGRYRLLARVAGPADAPAALWSATDEVLARPVAVKVLAATDPRAAAVLAAAARAGAVEARPLTRVYDAAAEPRHARRSPAYVIGEWSDGEPLADLLTRGPLSPHLALALSLQAAEALVAAHAAGVVHGRLHPGNVLVLGDRELRVTDAEVAVAVHGLPRPGPEQDVRDLGALLHAMLTARWPADATAQPGQGVPAAPSGGYAPRQLRAGVPRALDDVVVRALHPERDARSGRRPLDTAVALRDALELAGRTLPPVEKPPRAPRPGRLRRVAGWALLAALLAALVAVCYSLGRSVGEVPARDDGLPPLASGAATAAAVVPLAAAAVRDYDPHGAPPAEKPDQVANVLDGSVSTAWATELYRTERFGGLKSGVGLLVDLGSPVAVAEVDVGLAAAGTELELRAGDALGADETALPVVARGDGARTASTLAVPSGTTARYWLVWVTRLPRDGSQYRAGVTELRLLRR